MSCVRSRVVALMIVISYVAGVITEKSENKSENTLKFLPASKEFLARLAEDVCYDIINPANLGNDVEVDKCIKKFLRPSKNKNVPPPSKFSLMCRSKDLAMYSVAPSENRLLVVLLNDNIYAIPTYSIMNVLEETGTIVIQPNYNYTFWITTLTSDGTPTIWYRGTHVPPWREDQKEIVIVKINEPHIVYKNNLKVDAVFEIQFFGEHSLCSPDMEVVNKCKKMVPGDFFQAVISPNQNRSLEIVNLPIDDDCTFKVEGNGVYLKKKYRTSLSDAHVQGNKTLEEREFEPEIAQDVSLEAIETGDGWNIHVNWKRPIHDPDTYNLTLRAPGVFENVVIDGVSTEYTFQNVSGETMAIYNVSVAAINKIATATTVRRAQFPQRSSYQATIVYGSCIALLTVAVLALGAIVWRRRRHARLAKLSYISAPHTKPFKERNRKMEECLVGGMEDCWEVRSERLLLHEVIGEGAFGVVRKGTLAPNGKEVAVKMLKDFPTVEEIRSFRAEMELMKSVGAHPHVVSLVGCCSGRRPLIVAEYCSRGDLLSFLRCSWDVMVSKRNAKYYNNNIESSDYRNDLFKKPKDSKLSQLVVNKLYDLQGICDSELTSLDLLSFCRQIAMGMEFLASNRVVHRDLAARNILVTGDRTLKIADFGLSRDVYQENQYKQKGNGKMPVKWMALESLTHRIYTTQSDVWSFGVVIWEVVTVGGSPYPGVPAARLPRLLRAGYRMPKPNNCSKPLYELMLSCWRARPRDRPNFTELHRQLDELLNSACADDYLSLELDDDAPPTPKPQRYLKMLLRGNRVWARGEIYERPLKGPSNHYTSPPAPQAKPQAV